MPRYVTRIVDDDIPLAALEAVQAAIAVALDGFEIGEQRVVRAAAIE